MLYLEDLLEMMDHLPQEIRDRFTEMRELDLGVQNAMDSLDKRIKIFFSNAKKMKPVERDQEYESIRKEYMKALEDADEKVNLATQTSDHLYRYVRRLDDESNKLKMELEAENPGIGKILEKRSLELDQPSNSNQKENRYAVNNTRSRENYVSRDNYSSRAEKRRDSNSSVLSVEKKNTEKVSMSIMSESHVSNSIVTTQTPSISPTPTTNSIGSINYNLGHISAGGNAIAVAASQAIAATQHMQQGRRTASLKASYEAINSGGNIHEPVISKELAGAAQTAIAAIQESNKKNKKKATSVPNVITTSPPVQQTISTPVTSTVNTITDSDNPDWTYDPNEPRYCICNQVSYGDMVACDNADCPFEWFHYPCVGINAPPKGKWYCPQCTSSMKRRGSRKN